MEMKLLAFQTSSLGFLDLIELVLFCLFHFSASFCSLQPFFCSRFFTAGWPQKWRQWRRTAATTSCATSGPWASPPSSWLSCSRPCSTCTPCGTLLRSSIAPPVIEPPPRCRPRPIDVCFCPAQGFVPDVEEQLPASKAERQKQMVSVLPSDGPSHFGCHSWPF